MNLVLRAVIAAKWNQTALNANIHALIGNNSDKMVNEAGTVFYVVLGALQADKSADVDADSPDIRILRGAVNAIYDQAGNDHIDAARRASIVSGLLAAQRLIKLIPRKLVVDSACDLAGKLNHGHNNARTFQELLTA